MDNLIFEKDLAIGLYHIFCGLGSDCYANAEVYDEARPNMKKAYDKILEWGNENKIDTRGESIRKEMRKFKQPKFNVGQEVIVLSCIVNNGGKGIIVSAPLNSNDDYVVAVDRGYELCKENNLKEI